MTGEEEAADRLLPLGAEPQPAHPRIVNAPGPADQAQAFESLGLAGHRRGVDAQPFGQIGDAQAALLRVQRVQDRQPGLVDVETRLLEDEIVQPGLLEPSGQRCSADSMSAIVLSSTGTSFQGGLPRPDMWPERSILIVCGKQVIWVKVLACVKQHRFGGITTG